MEIAKIMDSTLLRADTRPGDVEALCREALAFGFRGVCVPPYYVPMARSLLARSSVRVVTVAGFPLGYAPARAKITEVRKVLEAGAQDVDMVVNIAALKAGDWDRVGAEMKWAVKQSRRAVLKMIIESCFLTDEEKIRVCELVAASGARFVKTSTGYGTGGATPADVRLLASVAAGRIGVKASGGISTLSGARELIAAGATCLGTSRAGAIMAECRAE